MYVYICMYIHVCMYAYMYVYIKYNNVDELNWHKLTSGIIDQNIS